MTTVTRKPPLGILPKWFVQEQRLKELKEAMARYRRVAVPVPDEWVAEERELEAAVMARQHDRDDRRVAKLDLTWEAVAAFVKAGYSSSEGWKIFSDAHPVNFVATAEGLTITWKHEEFPPIAEGGVIPHLAVVQRQHFEAWRCEVELAKKAAHQLDFPQAWHWPEWLKANWISMDADGTWSGWESRPFLALDNRWHGAEGGRKPLVDTRFVLPPCADWRESLWKNPNATT